MSTQTASFPRRAAAYALDIALAGVVLACLQFALRSAWGDARERLEGGGEWFAYLWLTYSAPVYVYFTLFESSPRRATLGKRAFGLEVSGVYGERISLLRALARTAIKLAPWDLAHVVLCFPAPPWDGGPAFEVRRGIFAVYVVLAVYLATTLMTRRKQAVHDLIVRTVVVRAPATRD